MNKFNTNYLGTSSFLLLWDKLISGVATSAITTGFEVVLEGGNALMLFPNSKIQNLCFIKY
jgi:hypothetical protein